MSLRSFLQSLPKVQLHCHLEGSIQPATFFALSQKHGIDLGARTGVSIERLYEFPDFLGFLELFKLVSQTVRTPEDFAQIARDYVIDAAGQNVRYAEIFISPSVWTYFQPHLDVRAAVTAIREALDEEGARHGVQIMLIADLTRNFGAEKALHTAKLAVSLRDLGVIGIGLGGDEVQWPTSLFSEAFRYARSEGMRCVAHAGEATGARSVREAIDILGAERIGHGIRAVEDPALIEDLAARRIPLELCPTSNRLTGTIAPEARHPIGAFHDRGIVCTIDVDDPALFAATLTDEFLYVADLVGTQALLQMARNAIDACFAPEARKIELRGELEAACAAAGAETAVARRTP